MIDTDRPTEIDAQVPPEPTDLLIFTDRDGDLWQRLDSVLVGERWRCIKDKVPQLLGASPLASWRWVMFNVAPIRPVQWADATSEVSA
ncbi:hypothetical protein [Actinomycetospora aeridis]|uniref:Uncharacterized protein n=1 Tax=Actinomycetospora aeridis TaxID=3129231 RepID=A0ABU8N3D3_9PSEU